MASGSGSQAPRVSSACRVIAMRRTSDEPASTDLLQTTRAMSPHAENSEVGRHATSARPVRLTISPADWSGSVAGVWGRRLRGPLARWPGRVSFPVGRRPLASVLLLLAAAAGAQPGHRADPGFWRVVSLRGADTGCLLGKRAADVAVVSCGARCTRIPWQLDERDEHGRIVLDQGPHPNPDSEPGRIDANDEILFLWRDMGEAVTGGFLRQTGARCVVEATAVLPGQAARRAYLVSPPAPFPPPDTASYLHYDAENDVVRGTRVALGFSGALPVSLRLVGDDGIGPDLLDRLKVRASARFLGLIPVGRDEGDLESRFLGWKAGPIRVVRRHRQWVRLGFGLRTPVFGSDTAVYPDWADLPVHLRLNFPPSYFFRGIDIRARLDFHLPPDWKFLVPGAALWLPVTGLSASAQEGVRRSEGSWFALTNGEVVLVNLLEVSPSLESVSRHIDYEDTGRSLPPEETVGERPGIGYRLTGWDKVPAGHHWFASRSYALPADWDVREFVVEQERKLAVRVRVVTGGRASQP